MKKIVYALVAYVLILVGVLLAIGEDPTEKLEFIGFLLVKVLAAAFLGVGVYFLLLSEDKKSFTDYCKINNRND